MNLESVMQSEVSQREKYNILMHINGSHRNSPDEPICRAGIETQIWEQTCGHSERRRGCDELRRQHCRVYTTVGEIGLWCEVT